MQVSSRKRPQDRSLREILQSKSPFKDRAPLTNPPLLRGVDLNVYSSSGGKLPHTTVRGLLNVTLSKSNFTQVEKINALMEGGAKLSEEMLTAAALLITLPKFNADALGSEKQSLRTFLFEVGVLAVAGTFTYK